MDMDRDRDRGTKFGVIHLPIKVDSNQPNLALEVDHVDQHWLKKSMVKQTKDSLMTAS